MKQSTDKPNTKRGLQQTSKSITILKTREALKKTVKRVTLSLKVGR